MGNGAFTVTDPTKAIALLTKLIPKNGIYGRIMNSYDNVS